MKSLPTIYNGNLFRSKLEAKWAAFFDELGILYHYEPDAFSSRGLQYTPDFYLPNSYLRYEKWKGFYLEIKPLGWDYDEEYTSRISEAMGEFNLVLFAGDPFDIVEQTYVYKNNGWQLSPWWDNYMMLVYCDKCRVLKAEFSESNYMYCPICGGDRHLNEIMNAAENSRQKRFKHLID